MYFLQKRLSKLSGKTLFLVWLCLAILTTGILSIVVPTNLERVIAVTYYGKEYRDLEYSKRRVLEGRVVEHVKENSIKLMTWAEKQIESSWLDSSNIGPAELSKLHLAQRNIKESVEVLLKPDVPPETRKVELGVLKEAVKMIPTEITIKGEESKTIVMLMLWGSVFFPVFLVLRVGYAFFCWHNQFVEQHQRMFGAVFAIAGIIIIIATALQIDSVIWTNALYFTR